MGIEIERKFLVDKEKWSRVLKPEAETIKQKYLVTDKEKTIRIRIKGEKGFITLKGKKKGLRRSEFEYEIPVKDAVSMMASFGGGMISKTRYKIKHEGKLWEVDEFHEDNEGLIVAEIELQTESETFLSPAWLGKEVSHDSRYYNSNLTIKPYNRWRNH